MSYSGIVIPALFLLSVAVTAAPAGMAADDDASACVRAAQDASAQGKTDKAAEAWAAAVKAYARQGDPAGEAKARSNLAAAYLALSDYPRAQENFKRAQDIYLKIGDVAGQAASITNLAEVSLQQGDFAASLALRNKALALRDQLNDDLGKAIDLIGIARIHSKKGERREAVDRYTEALKIFSSANNSEGIAAAVSGIGVEYTKLGAYDMALECHKHSREIHKGAANDLQEARDLVNIGNVHLAVSDYHAALDTYAEAFRMQERLNDKSGSAASLLNMGICSKNIGRYARSLQQLRAAFSKFEAIGNRSAIADCYTNLGVLFKNIGGLKQAENYYSQALRIHEKLGDSPNWAADLANLGVLCALRKDYKPAIKYFDQAGRIFEKTQDNKQAAIAVFNAAAALTEMGNLPEAAAKLTEATASFEKLGYTEGLAWCKFTRGRLEKKSGRLKGAQDLYKQALDISSKSAMPELACQCQGTLAGSMAEEGKTDDAIRMYAAAIDQIEQLRRNVGTFQLASSFLDKSSEIYHDLVSLLASRAKDDPTAAAQAFRYMEMGRARSFVDMLVESGIDVRQGANADLLHQQKLLLAKMSAVNSTIISEVKADAAPERIQALRGKLQDCETEYQKVQIDIKQKCPEYSSLFYPEPLTAPQVQQMLPPDAALLEYSVNKKASFLFALTRDAIQVYPLPPQAQIRAATDTFGEIMVSRNSRTYCTEAYRLYQMLVAPADALLKGKTRIIIVPDASLHYLAFECMLTEDSGRADFSRLPFFLRKAAISYAPSATALAEIDRRQKPDLKYDKEILICADPDFGSAGNDVQLAMRHSLDLRSSLARLPYSSLEARNVSSVFTPAGVVLLDRAAASEQRLKGMDLSSFKYIDFATHAVLDEERPEFSSIVLAQSDPDEDGFLMMQEIFNLKLNAKLVALSACSTARGRLLNGEGVVGISRAFFYAGTPAVVASLWNVNDASTAKLMTELFRALKAQNLPPAEALRQAKLKLIDTAGTSPFAVVPVNPSTNDLQVSGSYSHPFYWAAFILIGQ